MKKANPNTFEVTAKKRRSKRTGNRTIRLISLLPAATVFAKVDLKLSLWCGFAVCQVNLVDPASVSAPGLDSSETRLRLGMTHPALRAPLPRGNLCLTVASCNNPLHGGVPERWGGFDPPWETLHPAVSYLVSEAP